MALRLDDTDATSSGLFGEWYFPPRPIFMPSTTFDTLKREMAAYVRGDVLGRSFLIAAHRGVGKTSLVLRVVGDLQRAAIKDVAGLGTNAAASQRVGAEPRRPLLVKLTAGALLASPTPASASPPQKDTEVATADSGAAPTESATSQPDAGATRADPQAALPDAGAVLEQLTIALYRALAREAAQGFTQHARETDFIQAQSGRKPGILPELAAQLTLDLDLAPELTALRAAWYRLGHLRRGVLWPRQIGTDGRADRGIREIMAIATANQAFKECCGQISSSQSTNEAADRKQALEAQAKLDLKDAANKLWSLGAGALVGAALWHDHASTTAVAAGAGTALFSALALGWSASRSRSSERKNDYTFIVNHSLQTLDRDLPVVIDRVRETGLAPIFLIDELDKLERPAECIAAIIGRLKSLTTDYGFFCFLTDRAYYDELEEKLRREAYPVEHTFFSHRLLVTYRPADLAHYVRQLWTIDEKVPAEAQAAWIVTCVILHRARLNSMDIRRELARLCNADGALRPQLNEICTQAEYLLPMVIQLAIEHVLRGSDIRRRVRDDDAFAQLAFDVLYMISRAWHGGGKVHIDADQIRLDLISRRRLPGTPAEALLTLQETASDKDIETLTAKALHLAELLESFATIQSALTNEDDFSPTPSGGLPTDPVLLSERDKIATLAPLLRGIPGASTGLLQATGQPGTFRFLFNRYGVEQPATPLADQLATARKAVECFDSLELALRDYGLSVADLIAFGVLPATLDHAALNRAADLIRSAQTPYTLRAVPEADLAQLTGFPGIAATLARAVVGITALASAVCIWVFEVTVTFGPSESQPKTVLARQAMAAIDRMLGMAPLVALLSASQSATPGPIVKSPDSPVVEALLQSAAWAHPPDRAPWRQAMSDEASRLYNFWQPVKFDNLFPFGATKAWPDRALNWLINRATPANPPITFDDIVAAATGAIVPTRLRPDMENMTVGEWSQFCLNAFTLRDQPRLAWAFTASLRALGFDHSVLIAAGDPQFAANAPAKPPGILYIESGAGEFNHPPDPASGPVFLVPKASRARYTDVVAWLRNQKALIVKGA